MCRQRFEPLEIEETAVNLIRAGLGDDVDDAARRAAKFRRGSRGDYLKLFHGIKRNVYSGALPAKLLSEKSVVVVTTVQTYVVEDAALAGESDFVAVRTLDNTYARGESQQVFKLSSQNWRRADRCFVQRGAGLGFHGIDGGRGSDRYPLLNLGYFHRQPQVHGLSHC